MERIDVDFTKLQPIEKFGLLTAVMETITRLHDDPEKWAIVEEKAESLRQA